MKGIAFLFFLLLRLSAWAQQDIRLVLPVGHTGYVWSAEFSPDGKRIVTASSDGTVKVWDVSTGKLLQDLEGHTFWVNSAEFSSDGKRIVTASNDKTAKVWDASTGKLLQDLEGHYGAVNSAEFSPDGKRIVTASRPHTVKVWDVSTGKLLQDLKGHGQEVTSAEFSPDGTRIVTASKEETAKVWDVSTGKLLQDLEGHIFWVNSAEFSSDGKRIVTASNDGTAKVWDVTTGKLLQDLAGHTRRVNSAEFSPDGKRIVTASDDKTAKVWDASTGKLLQDLKGHTDDIISVEFSPDGTRIVTASSDNTAKVWDASTGKLLQDLAGHTSIVRSAEFSPDGQRIVTASLDGTAKVWDVSTGKLLQDLAGHTRRVNSAEFSSDEKWIVTASGDGSAYIWDVSTGKLLQDLAGHTDEVTSAEFSPDGQRIVTASEDETAKVWDVTTGKLLQDLAGHTRRVNSAEFSPDGKRIVTASGDRKAKVWDASTGKLLQDLEGFYGAVNSAEFSPDGKRIVTASDYENAKIWDVSTGKLLQDLAGHTRSIESAEFSPDGTRIVTASWDRKAKIWDVSTGKLLQDLAGHTGSVSSAEFSPDGTRIVTASWDRKAKIWDVSTGKLLQDLEGHSGAVLSAKISPYGQRIVTASWDHSVKLWDAVSGKNLYTRLQLKDGDWLVYDEHYRYDGSPGARDYLYFVCGSEIIDLAQMKDALYVPGLVEKIMNGEDINYPKLSDLDICDALPLVEKMEDGRSSYRYRILPRKMGLHQVEVYVNDKRIYVFPAGELEKEGEAYILGLTREEVELHFIQGAENKVRVIGTVLTEKGNELRSRGIVVVSSSEARDSSHSPKLFAVMVGVNEYKDPQLKLKYPVKDVMDLSSALEASAVKLLGRENVSLYRIHTNVKAGTPFSTPEKEGIRRALKEIGKEAKPEDVILLFLAGHGVMQGVDEKLFTFLTAEASNDNLTGINTRELQDWLSYEGPYKILANKAILIFDACNSGQATNELIAWRRNDDDSRRKRQVEDLKDKSGMFILAASAPDQAAYELPQYEQGLLTYSLLHVLKHNTEILDQGQTLNVQKWFLESEKYLKELAASQGLEQQAQPFGSANIRIGVVDEEVRRGIVLAKEKPLILCANVQNLKVGNDNLQLKELVNKELAGMAERSIGSPVAFARAETPSANKININYEANGNEVFCTVYLFKANQLLHQVEISGNSGDLTNLAKLIVEKVVGYAR